jgi:hypothetical protein
MATFPHAARGYRAMHIEGYLFFTEDGKVSLPPISDKITLSCGENIQSHAIRRAEGEERCNDKRRNPLHR